MDASASSSKGCRRRWMAGVSPRMELLAGSQLIESAAEKAKGKEAGELRAAAASLKSNDKLPVAARVAIGGSSRIAELMWSYSEREYISRSREFRMLVDPVLARFG